ncbi:Cysteine-rich protein 2-binding protein [Mortierella sp. GBA30]|nr:Cysteine-rich protein 2-binding protein [Mortierella sp. GBA30]
MASYHGDKPVLQFPYEPSSLHWAPNHKSNAEGVYCYCGEGKDPDEPMLPCQTCGQLFHSGCVSCLTKPLLKGDEFFKYECSVCRQGPEFFERAALSWVILVHLVLYNLMEAHPEQKYFRWKEEICKFIYEYWSYLLPDKEQSPTWNNTVASVLSVQNHIFHSGVETKGASGWWTLIEKAPPDRNRKLKPKNKAVQRSSTAKHSSSKTKEKRARTKGSPSRKKTRFDETSSDDDFHTSAKPRPLSTAPTTRIKSRQFSLSSGSSLSSAGDSEDSTDEDVFWKSDEEREVRPVVHLHGIPACIQHHFNPSGLDFSAGPIHLEEVFRITDLIDESSPGRLIHRVNSLCAMSAGGKKKRRKSSAVEIKTETIQHFLDESLYDQDVSDVTEDDDLDEDNNRSTDASEVDSGSDVSGNDMESHYAQDAHGRAMAAKRTAGKRFNHPSSPRKSGVGRRSSIAPPTSGGKFGRRKSSLKDHTSAFEAPRKLKSVSMAEDMDLSHPSTFPMLTGRVGGGKKFSQAHMDAMAMASASDQQDGSKPGPKPKIKAKPRAKTPRAADNNSVISHSTSKTGVAERSPEGLSSVESTLKAPPALTIQQLQRQQEWHILQVLEDASKTKALPTIAARFKRKLHLKRLKAFLQLPLFDMEAYIREHLASPLDLTRLSKHIPPDPYELRRLREEQFRAKIQKIDHTPYGHSFASRLLGQPVECQTRKPWEALWKSPFSGRGLKDYIWRDYESRSVMMDVLSEIRMCQGRPLRIPRSSSSNMGMKRKREDSTSFGSMETEQHPDNTSGAFFKGPNSIDYCYFRREHLLQVNEILCRRFWPGIDMTEALQYPEYSVVVLYKRLVVGCAFMTPEGYITYVAVSAGWEKAGIGQ